MAKITVEFDTVTKTMAATIDGTAVDNVVAVDMSPSWDDQDEFRCCLTTFAEDKEKNLKVMTRVMAAATRDGQVALKAGGHISAAFPEFVVKDAPEASRASRDIAQFFGRG